MAKYIVTDSYKPSYEKNYKLPLINIVPAVIWSIPFHQKLFLIRVSFAFISFKQRIK